MFHCLVIKVLCSPSCDSSFSLSQSFLFVKNFFKFFQNFLMAFVIRCLSATRLLYHIHFWMSSTFLKFFIFSKFKTSNGEGGIWTLAPLLTTYSLSRGAPSASLGTSPNCPTQSLLFFRSVLYYIALFFICQELF